MHFQADRFVQRTWKGIINSQQVKNSHQSYVWEFHPHFGTIWFECCQAVLRRHCRPTERNLPLWGASREGSQLSDSLGVHIEAIISLCRLLPESFQLSMNCESFTLSGKVSCCDIQTKYLLSSSGFRTYLKSDFFLITTCCISYVKLLIVLNAIASLWMSSTTFASNESSNREFPGIVDFDLIIYSLLLTIDMSEFSPSFPNPWDDMFTSRIWRDCPS